MVRPAKSLVKSAVAASVATAFTTGSLVWAQAQKEQAVPPRTVPKDQPAPPREVPKDAAPPREAVKAEFRIDFAPARAVAPALIMEKAVRLAPPITLPAVPVGAAPEAALEAMTQQFTQQLRPLLRVELRVLTSVCEPSPAQRREIALEGAKAVKETARKLAVVQHALQNGGWQGGTFPDARKSIRDGLLAAAKTKLSPEQAARYQLELNSKAQEQRKAIALNLVANLDRLLFLSNDQREKIGEELLSHWDDRTFPTLENLVNYETYFPVLPERYIAPILNVAQRNTWNGVQKVTFGQSFNFNFNNGIAGQSADEDEDEKAAMAEVEKKK